MSVILVHLSDLHVKNSDAAIFKRWDVLCRAVQAEINEDIEACVIIFNGDAAYSGRAEQFALAVDLLKRLQTHVAKARDGMPVHVLTVPGNHDCDLTSEDLEARVALRTKLEGNVPSPSIARGLLSAQSEYFKFSQQIGTDGSALSPETPYYRWFDVQLRRGVLRVHLLNSSWTSVLRETDDLRYPLPAFVPPSKPEAHYSIAAIHHPVHWFLMPGIRRELRDLLEAHADLILTGHEHENEASQRLVLEGGEITYIEGGVLSEEEKPELCTFNTIRLDFDKDVQIIRRFRFDTDHFELDGDGEETSLTQNRLRIDRHMRLTSKFEEWLDELEDPLTHPRQEDLRLSHLFTYPELRKVTAMPDEDEKRGKHADLIDRVKSEDVVVELTAQERVLLVGGDKAGKTSLLKRLFADFYHRGFVPLFVKAGDIVRSGNTDHFRKQIQNAVQSQYQFCTPAAFEQLPSEQKMLLMDDFHEGPQDAGARRRILDFVTERFGKSILAASNDLCVELLPPRGGEDVTSLLLYQRYEIAEFGKQRFEELALRWTSLGRTDHDPAQLRTTALELCEKVHSLIAVAGLPHTPWLLAVILEHDESPDATVAAKNGDYGHLYHAVITVRLARSKFTRFNLNGKFTYLSELAYFLYRNNKAILSNLDARQFHSDHAARYDLNLDFEQVRDDLIDTRMLRRDGDELAFRHKYVFAFFVAYWLSRNIHKEEAQNVVKQLGERLHHDVSANVLLFLSHLTDHPVVLQEMRAAAGRLFRDAKLAGMAQDVQALNQLDGVEGFFTLPPTAPEVNRRLLQDSEDDHLTKQRDSRRHDGRAVRSVPEAEPDKQELHGSLRELRASLRTIRILGQVLRNKALSTEGQDKVALMHEVIGLEHRLLGYLYGFLDDLDKMVLFVRKRLMPLMVEAKREENREKKRINGELDEGTASGRLNRAVLRELWEQARIMSNRFWFDMYWLGSFGVIKRVASAIGSRELDATFAKVKAKDNTLPVHLVELSARLHRRTSNIPVDDVVKLHEELAKGGNKLARVVLEAIAWERLLLFDTEPHQKQAICKQMGIRVPVISLDSTRKKFLPKRSNRRKGKSS